MKINMKINMKFAGRDMGLDGNEGNVDVTFLIMSGYRPTYRPTSCLALRLRCAYICHWPEGRAYAYAYAH
jgi:hypothetical protein